MKLNTLGNEILMLKVVLLDHNQKNSSGASLQVNLPQFVVGGNANSGIITMITSYLYKLRGKETIQQIEHQVGTRMYLDDSIIDERTLREWFPEMNEELLKIGIELQVSFEKVQKKQQPQRKPNLSDEYNYEPVFTIHYDENGETHYKVFPQEAVDDEEMTFV